MTGKNDTIAAISTPLAPGGLGVIRVSGPRAAEIADAVFKSTRGTLAALGGYRALYGKIYDGGASLDDCVALRYVAPASYTGEDTVELSCHGGVYLLRRVLSLLISAGARQAGPGEFTERAFLNGKLDLSRAEAVMNVISAESEQALRAANSQKNGALSRKISQIKDKLTETAAHLAAWIDFPDDDIPPAESEEITDGVKSALAEINSLLAAFESGAVLRGGVSAVIAGKPNAGKSTLMNLLAGYDRSIVTETAGTTRDVVEETVSFGGITLRLADTAGLRDAADAAERIGVEKARGMAKNAGVILAVFDASRPLTAEDEELCALCSGRPAVAVINKTDLPRMLDAELIKGKFCHTAEVCARTGRGADALAAALRAALDYAEPDLSAAILANERQRDCAERAAAALRDALRDAAAGQTPDIVCVLLDEALAALMELSGEAVSDAVTEEIFSKFCIGK